MIPKIIHVMGKDPYSENHERVKENIEFLKTNNPEFEVRYYSDIELEYLLLKYSEKIYHMYALINDNYGALRSDLLRLVLMYEFGGYYIDLKSTFEIPINFQSDKLVVGHWNDHSLRENSKRTFGGEGTFTQSILVSPKNNQIFLDYLEICYQNIINNPNGKGRDIVKLSGPVSWTKFIFGLPDDSYQIIDWDLLGYKYSIFPDKTHRDELYVNDIHYSRNRLPILKTGLDIINEDIKNKCSFVTTYYNTPIEMFREYVKHILKHNIHIIIVNDGSDKEHTKNLYDLMGNNQLVNIIEMGKNQGHISALERALENVNTEYVIRCDSDDLYMKFPKFNEEDKDFEVLLLKKAQNNLIEFLQKGRSHIGSIFKTSVMREIYSRDLEYLVVNFKWLHEDQWRHLNLLNGDYNLKYTTSDSVYKRQFNDFSLTRLKSISPTKKRWETFMLWCMYNDKFELHLECQREIFGVENSITKNWGNIQLKEGERPRAYN